MAISEKRCTELQDILEDIENYFDDRADADCEGDPPRYVPNEAMQMFVKVKEARFWIDQLIRDNCKQPTHMQSEPHTVSMEEPNEINDPIGRFRNVK